MDIVLAILAIACVLCGLVGCIVPVLPGPPIAYVGILLAHWTTYVHFSNQFLITWAIITVGATVLDYFLPIWFTKKFGGSRLATRGATIGLVLGFLVMPVGLILGPFLGALIGEMIHDRQNNAKAFRVAFGSFAAFVFGTGMKLVACLFMTFYVIRGIFF